MTRETLTVHDLVARQKSTAYHWVPPSATVQEAAHAMYTHKISAIPIVQESADGLELRGILSEKDVSHLIARGADPTRIPVERVMTADLVTVNMDTTLWDTAKFMLERNIRHLPVMEDGAPRTTISIRDVLGQLLDYLASENESLQADLEWLRYMHGT